MKLSAAIFILITLLAANAWAQPESSIAITRLGAAPAVKASDKYFTGTAYVDSRFKAADPARLAGGTVVFEPGARTAWHTHPLGQTLIVTEGVGWVQQFGSPIQEIKVGDIVRIPPGVKHWHGASATFGMTHIAITEVSNGKTVDWMEKVSDQQYGMGNNPAEK